MKRGRIGNIQVRDTEGYDWKRAYLSIENKEIMMSLEAIGLLGLDPYDPSLSELKKLLLGKTVRYKTFPDGQISDLTIEDEAKTE